jgi:hypothetical protein
VPAIFAVHTEHRQFIRCISGFQKLTGGSYQDIIDDSMGIVFGKYVYINMLQEVGPAKFFFDIRPGDLMQTLVGDGDR